MRISALFNKLSATGAGWKATALVCALVLTACGKGGAGTGASGANVQPSFSYATNPAYYILGTAITANTLNISNAATSYSISPSLPTGLSFSTTSGTISGTPTVSSAATSYTVTGHNSTGSNFTTVTIGADDVGSISYGGPLTFEQGTSVGTVTPTVSGGSVSSCTISPSLPAGLSFNTSNCAITGTPTTDVTAPSYTVTPYYAGVANSSPLSESITITQVAPQITTYPSGGALSFDQGVSVGTITPTVSNGPITSCAITPTYPSLPAGLTLNTTNCDITGTPTTVQGSTSYSVTSSNSHGSAPYGFTITITDPVPSINYAPNSGTFTYNQAITTVTPTTSGGALTSCSPSPALPAGLSLNSSCQISGTPTALIASPGTTYTITPSGPGGAGSGVSYTITVNDALPTISFSGSPYTFSDNSPITTITATRTAGSTITSCAVAPALPTGLTLSVAGGTCQIAGTPIGASAATNYTITPTNSAGPGTGATISIKVAEQAPNIGFSGNPFNFTLNSSIGASGVSTNSGGENLTSCTSSPALPGGLSIAVVTSGAPYTNNICQITGTPNLAQSATNYIITASNSAGSSTVTISIAVSTGGAPNISYAGSPYTWNAGPVAGNPISLTPANSGGVISSCSISPAPPGGISFSTTTCALNGTPTVGVGQAATNYTITATNVNGNSSATISVAITTVPVISYPGSPYTFTKGTAISAVTPTNTGSAATTCTSGTWGPSGLTLNADCSISGTPTALIASPGTAYSIANSNGDGSGTAASVTIIVNDAAPTLSYSPTTYTFNKNVAIAGVTPTVGGGTITSCTSSPLLPAGLSIPVASTCKITGTPTVFVPSQTYTITASNTGGSASENLTIAVNDSIPAISYGGTPFTFKVGTSIGVTGATTLGGGAVTSCSVSPALPTGLSMDTACNITGTPTVGQNATNYTVSATNTGGTQNLNISIAVNSKPVISYVPSSYTYTKGVAITALNPTNAGFGGITSCTIAPNVNTNTGLTFSAVNCQISGTPTSISGATVYTVTPTLAGLGAGLAATVTIGVNDAAPTLSFSPTTYTFNKNVAASATPTVGGGAITTCTSSPTLPAGLSIPVASTCQITGTPTVYAPSQTYTITATNTGGSASQSLTISVNDAIPAISYATPFSFNIGTSIGTTGQPTLGGGAVTSCAVAPALPAGLSINTACNITGTPTVMQIATSYTISATNSGGTQNIGISIAVITVPVLSYAGPYVFGNGTAITTITPTNTGSAATSCSSTPNLTGATGLTLNTDCSISGTPTITVAAANYSITGTNADGTSAAAIVNIAVVNAPVISYSPSSDVFTLRTAISTVNVTNTGGAPSSCSSSPSLPSGLGFDSSCDITGTPTVTSSSTSYTITATNAAGSANATISIRVKDQPEILFYSFMNTSGVWNASAEMSENAFQVTKDGQNLVALTANNGSSSDEYDTIFPSWLSTGGTTGAGTVIFSSLTALSGLWNGTAASAFNIWSAAEGGGSMTNLGGTNTATSALGAATLATPVNGAGNANGFAFPEGVISPDGTKIAFTVMKSSGGATSLSANIWIMNVDGTGATNLTNITNVTGMDCRNPVWDPTSSIIYFQSKLNQGDNSGNYGGGANTSANIWSINTTGTTLTRITNETGGTERDCIQPSVSPDGSNIAYASRSKNAGATGCGTISATPGSFNIWIAPSTNVRTNGTPLTCNDPAGAGTDSLWPKFSNTTTGTGFGGYYAITFQSKMGTTATMTSGNDSTTASWTAAASSSFNIWTVTSVTGTLTYTYLTNNTSASLDSVTPLFAPDDSVIVFGSEMNVGGSGSSCYNVWTMTPSGSSQSNVTANTSSGLDSYLAPTNVMYIAQ